MKITYDIHTVAPYINWAYFFFAWTMHNKPEEEKAKLRQEAETLLDRLDASYHTYALFEIFDAYSEGDDVVVEVEPHQLVHKDGVGGIEREEFCRSFRLRAAGTEEEG